MELFKLLSANELVAQIVAFLLLFFLLRVLFWKKLLGLLDARKEKIASEFKALEVAKQKTDELKLDYETRIALIEKEARAKLQEAIDAGIVAAGEVIEEAHKQAHEIIEKAKLDSRYEIAQAKEELKKEIIDLTIRAAEELVQDKLTEEDDRRIVRNFLDKIDTIE